MSLNAKEEAEWLFAQTGKYPALIGLDFMNHNRNYSWFDKSVLGQRDEELVQPQRTGCHLLALA